MKSLITLAVVLPALLSGCFFDTGLVTETINGVTTTTASAIVAREDSLNKVKINRDKQQTTMHKSSGILVKWDYKEYKLIGGGIAVLPLLREITVREYPRFQQDLPMHPKDHRVWDTVDTGINAVLMGFGIYQLAKWGETTSNNGGTHYNGPYASESYNPTTTEIPYAIQ